jgi:hypothetical protein
MITETVKIPIENTPNTTFNSRERTINVEVQKLIDAYSKRGLTVVDREVVNKTATHANVKFTLQPMFRGR